MSEERQFKYAFSDEKEFTLDQLFLTGRLCAEVIIHAKLKATLQSLLTAEIHLIDADLKVDPNTSIRDYNNKTALKQLSYSVTAVNGKTLPADPEKREAWLLTQSAIVTDRLMDAYLEFSERANLLFKSEPTGKKEDSILKKS